MTSRLMATHLGAILGPEPQPTQAAVVAAVALDAGEIDPQRS